MGRILSRSADIATVLTHYGLSVYKHICYKLKLIILKGPSNAIHNQSEQRLDAMLCKCYAKYILTKTGFQAAAAFLKAPSRVDGCTMATNALFSSGYYLFQVAMWFETTTIPNILLISLTVQ